MNRTVKYALSVAMTAAFVIPAFAQDTNFPDVKENHWAYEALARMKKEGILVGYPDGKYRGGRLATRYELAVAINAAYTNLKTITDGLSKQIDDINTKLSGMNGGASAADLDNLRSALNDLKGQVDGMKAYGQDIADLKKLTDKFEKELQSMGVDVDELKKNLSSLDKRVTVLESKKLPVDIHGDAEAIAIGGYGTSGSFGVTVDGRPTGVGRKSNAGGHASVDTDFTVLHEAALDLTSTNTTGPKFHAVAVAGNMFGTPSGVSTGGGFSGQPFGTQSTLSSGSQFIEGQNEVYFQELNATFDTSVAGLAFTGRIGRIGLKISPYIFERPDTTPYFTNARWDNGEYDVDGLDLGFKAGNVKISVFAARTSDQQTSSGVPIQPLLAGQSAPFLAHGTGTTFAPVGFTGQLLQIDQMLGAHAMIPLGANGSVDLAYIILGADQTATDASFTGVANRVNVYGGDVKYNFSGLKFTGGYSKSDVFDNSHSLVTKNNQRATGYLAYDKDNFGVSAGYKYIEPYYGAPGYWGRIGLWWNPTDIEGLDSSAHIDLGKALDLKGTFEYYTGTGKVAGGLTKSDKIYRGTADLGYKVGAASTFDLGYEYVQWNLSGFSGKPTEQWVNIGYGYDFSSDAKLSILWQISNYDAKNQAAFGLFGASQSLVGPVNTAKGGLITTQVSFKF